MSNIIIQSTNIFIKYKCFYEINHLFIQNKNYSKLAPINCHLLQLATKKTEPLLTRFLL